MAIDSVMSLTLCLQVMSQATQHLKIFWDASHGWCWVYPPVCQFAVDSREMKRSDLEQDVIFELTSWNFLILSREVRVDLLNVLFQTEFPQQRHAETATDTARPSLWNNPATTWCPTTPSLLPATATTAGCVLRRMVLPIKIRYSYNNNNKYRKYTIDKD